MSLCQSQADPSPFNLAGDRWQVRCCDRLRMVHCYAAIPEILPELPTSTPLHLRSVLTGNTGEISGAFLNLAKCDPSSRKFKIKIFCLTWWIFLSCTCKSFSVDQQILLLNNVHCFNFNELLISVVGVPANIKKLFIRIPGLNLIYFSSSWLSCGITRCSRGGSPYMVSIATEAEVGEETQWVKEGKRAASSIHNLPHRLTRNVSGECPHPCVLFYGQYWTCSHFRTHLCWLISESFPVVLLVGWVQKGLKSVFNHPVSLISAYYKEMYSCLLLNVMTMAFIDCWGFTWWGKIL